jgi:ATP-dependent RNA helicase RhlE
MLDMGFAPAIRRILAATPPRRQTMMFSATMPPEVRKLSEEFMEDPETVEVTPAGTPVERIQQEVTYIPHANKPEALNYLLEEHAGTVLVFARTRHGARKVAKALRTANHSACEIHSDRTMAQRKDALTGFKSGRYRVMVATTCRITPRTTCTALAARAAPDTRAARSPSPRRSRPRKCAPSSVC